MATAFMNSFGVKAAKLWNLLPANVKGDTELESFKATLGRYLATVPDTPPTLGYKIANNKFSVLAWNRQRGNLGQGVIGGST